MSEKKAVTPTSFIEILIELAKEVPVGKLALVRSTVAWYGEDGRYLDSMAVRIGKDQILTLPPGKYKLRAHLGGVMSEFVAVEAKSGQIQKIVFHFGKPE